TEHYDEVGLVSRRLRKLKSNTNKGVISKDAETLELNTINDITLGIINNYYDNNSSQLDVESSKINNYYVSVLIIIAAIAIGIFFFSKTKSFSNLKRSLVSESNKIMTEISKDNEKQDNEKLSLVCDTDIIPQNTYNYSFSQNEINKLIGDFNGDGLKENLIITRDISREYKDYEDTYGGGTCILQITNNDLDMLILKNCPFIKIFNEGDLRDNGKDAISIHYSRESSWGSVEIFTFSESDNWERILYFPTWSLGGKEQGRIIKEEKGYFKIIEDIMTDEGDFIPIERIITN
ncbi:MAG: hypothetical protein ACI85O_003120, partial [Saprospiraceae bacterium]